MNEQFLEMLKKEYDVTESNIGNDANLSKSGMKFNIRSFEVKGLGHLCLMSMKAMLGLMKMETAVLSMCRCSISTASALWGIRHSL